MLINYLQIQKSQLIYPTPLAIDGSPILYTFSQNLERIAILRRLIHVQIVHTADDFGSLAGFIRDEYGRNYGRQKWREHIRAITEKWRQIREKVMNLDLEWERVRLYQDGLPVCGKEREIVCKLVQDGNINYEIVWDLVQKGAILEGTEDPQLLRQEYSYILKIAQARNLAQRDRMIEEYNKAGVELLSKRDQFIAKRIDQTLKQGEMGLLFLGAMHRVDRFIPKDIEIKRLE